MNCEKIQNIIAEFIFENGAYEEKEIMTHIESCSKCNKHYYESLKSKQLIQEIKDTEPVLDRPEELTDSIMQSIANEVNEYQKPTFNYTLITRLLAAAIIALILTLGIEQYIVLNKLLILETKLGNVQMSNSIDRTRIYKASLMDLDRLTRDLDQGTSLSKTRALMRFKQAKHLNFTYSDIRRYMNEDEFSKNQLTKQLIQGNE